MEITVLGSAGGQAPGLDTTGFRIGSDLLLDAGAVGLYLDAGAQRAIRHVLLTHPHLDHLHALPFLLDNLVGRIAESVTIYGTDGTLEAVRRHIFNGLIWPDFTVIPTPQTPIARLQPVETGRPFIAGAFRVEAVPVTHSVPGVGYLVSGDAGTVAFTGDTGPTQSFWERLRTVPELRAIFMETSFPSSRQEMGALTRHLTTADVCRELAKLGRTPDIPIYLYHIKPEFTAEIAREAEAITPWKVRPVRMGEVIQV